MTAPRRPIGLSGPTVAASLVISWLRISRLAAGMMFAAAER